MSEINSKVEAHYNSRKRLYEDILDHLMNAGIEPTNATRKDLAGLDELHVGGTAASLDVANMFVPKNVTVLDLGCGIGGSSRMLADEFGCQVTGIDLNREYIRTAEKLAALLGFEDNTSFVAGDATNLPFDNGTFECVWTQHAQMNIPNKAKLYGEIARVLKVRGRLVYYDIFTTGSGEIAYPMPWAETKDISFLMTTRFFHNLLRELGLTRIASQDRTQKGIEFFDAQFERQREQHSSLNISMGDTISDRLRNLRDHFAQGLLTLECGTYIKD